MDIVIGKVIKPHGIRGEVKVLPITDDPARFYELGSVFCGDQHRKISACSVREGYVYLRFEGLDDRDTAEALRDLPLSVPRDQAIPLPTGSWFVCDLMGCTVSDDSGKELGTLTQVLQSSGVDVYVVDGGKLMFPALKKVLQRVDVENKTILVASQALCEVAVYAD